MKAKSDVNEFIDPKLGQIELQGKASASSFSEISALAAKGE